MHNPTHRKNKLHTVNQIYIFMPAKAQRFPGTLFAGQQHHDTDCYSDLKDT